MHALRPEATNQRAIDQGATTPPRHMSILADGCAHGSSSRSVNMRYEPPFVSLNLFFISISILTLISLKLRHMSELFKKFRVSGKRKSKFRNGMRHPSK